MSDIRAPDVKDLAEKDYIAGMKYKDIAAKYDVSLNTVKSWKTRYKWNRNGVHTSKKVCTQKKNIKNKDRESVHQEVEEVLNNSELTDKQKLFCIYYIKYFNATKAAIKAGYSKDTAAEQGSRLLSNVKIQEEVKRLKASKFKGALLEKEDLLQKYIDIAFADITDYVEFGQEEIPVMGAFGPIVDKKTKEVITRVVNVVKFKESVEVDGTIIGEVKQGRDGASIKLQDKMKALGFLAKNIGLLDMETQSKLKNEEAKLKMAREKLELEKSKVMGIDDEVGDDGFLEALKGEISEVWDNE